MHCSPTNSRIAHNSQKSEETWNRLCLGASRRNPPRDTLIRGHWPPELREKTKPLAAFLCYGSPSKEDRLEPKELGDPVGIVKRSVWLRCRVDWGGGVQRARGSHAHHGANTAVMRVRSGGSPSAGGEK